MGYTHKVTPTGGQEVPLQNDHGNRGGGGGEGTGRLFNFLS